ncbi:MAG: Mur ligase domain-containing protein, partial [Spirochaetia bacterium]
MTDKNSDSALVDSLTPKKAGETAGIVLEESFSGGSLQKAEQELSGAAVDSRSIAGGELFVALKGERTDGHNFLKEAVQRGASAVLVSRSFRESTE